MVAANCTIAYLIGSTGESVKSSKLPTTVEPSGASSRKHSLQFQNSTSSKSSKALSAAAEISRARIDA
jgi:hypothetical protein